MVKIRVEDTCANKVFETECDGVLISMHQYKENGSAIRSVISGSFDVKLLKRMQKDIKNIIKRALKGEGRVE